MSQVLYRKYRSQTFDEIIGQEHITKLLRNAVKKERLSHAYLFVGSRGTGKTSAARILAKAINCKKPQEDGNPCNKCEVCKGISNGTFLDLIEIDAASNRGIDQIRQLKEKIEFTPSEGKYKVYIIDEVHMLTNEAFNALLKTLEEPPEYAIFILATTEVHKLPATILSRCQRYDFKLGSHDELKSKVLAVSEQEGVKLADTAVKLLVENAQGSYRDALSLLDVVVSGQMSSDKPNEISELEVRTALGIPDTTMSYYFLEKLVYGEKEEAIELIKELNIKGVNLQQFIKCTLNMLRDILVKKISGTFDENEYSFAKELSEQQIIELINLFISAERNIKSISIPVLALEMIIPQANFNVEGRRKSVEKKKEKVETNGEEKKEGVGEKIGNIVAKTIEKVTNKKADECKENSNLTLEQIKAKWKDLTKEIKVANGHLFAFLEMANLFSFENNVLRFEVPYEFHKERIDSPRSKEAILTMFKKIYGCTFSYDCVVNASLERKGAVEAEVVEIVVPAEKKVEKKAEDKENIASEPVQDKKKFFNRGLGKDIDEIFASL